MKQAGIAEEASKQSRREHCTFMDSIRDKIVQKKCKPKDVYQSIEVEKFQRSTLSPQVDAFERFQERGSLLGDGHFRKKRVMAFDKSDICQYEEKKEAMLLSP